MEITYWTDYPLVEFGDRPATQAPKRAAVPLTYDGDKYVTCEVLGKIVEFKAGYLYASGDGKPISRSALALLPRYP